MGFVVEVEGVGRALVGNTCGRDHFGLDWNRETGRFEQLVARKAALVRLQDAEPFVDQLLALTDAMTEGANRLDSFIDEFGRASGKLSQQLVRAVRDHNGGLMVTVTERSREAEEEAARRRVPHLVYDVELARDPVERRAARRQLDSWIDDFGRVHVDRLEQRGRVNGGAVLGRWNLVPRILAATTRLRQVRDQMRREVDDPASLIAALREVGHAYTDVMARNGDLDVFTSAANLKAVDQWRRQVDGLYGTIPAVKPWKAEGRSVVQALWTVVGKA